MRLHSLALVLLAALLVTMPAAAQTVPSPSGDSASQAYRPALVAPRGREVVVVFISASFCIANRQPDFKPAVREMMRRVGVQRDSGKRTLSVTGVALDWSPRVGFAYLDSLGAFDEIVTGRNWFGSAAARHIWQAPDGVAMVPQVVFVERTVEHGGQRVTITGERELGRITGGDKIAEWAKRGAPVPMPGATTTAGIP